MESNLISLADMIRREAQRTNAFLELASFLEHEGSLEQAAQERDRALEKSKLQLADMHDQIDQTAAKLAEAKKRVDEAYAIAETTVTKAQGDAQDITAQANIQAGAIFAAAKDEADTLKAKAEREANQATADAAQKVADANKTLDDLAKKQAKLAADIEAKSIALADLQAKIQDAKQAARKLIEG